MSTKLCLSILCAGLLTLIHPVVSPAKGSVPGVNQQIEKLLQVDELTILGVDILTRELILEVYQERGFAPYWTQPERIRELMELISDSVNHGLTPADYNIDQVHRILQSRLDNPAAETEAEAEILLTESLLRYGYHRRFGKVKASALDPDINFRRETFKHQALSTTIEQAFASFSLADFAELLAPTGMVYKKLQAQMQFYRQLAANGGWATIPEGPTLRVGDKDERVALVRNRLNATGRITGSDDQDPALFDQALESAIEDFQFRHQLDQDGAVGPLTLASLNMSVEERINQIRASLERLRWARQENAKTLVVVNIAGFRAFFIKDGEIEWETRAMVGKHYRQTPVFRGDIAYLEFNPTWTIPPGILRNDILPAIKRDPGYLGSKHIRVIDRQGAFVDPATVDWNKYSRGVPYTLRQDAGPHNALGTVKFIFPNQHFVFLHDTPHRELFEHRERSFSSGCIRIQDPLKLAELVLDDPVKHSRDKLQAIVDSRETQRIHPSPKMPVVIVYLTASVNGDGTVRFYRDIYDRDQKVLDALDGPVTIQPPGA